MLSVHYLSVLGLLGLVAALPQAVDIQGRAFLPGTVIHPMSKGGGIITNKCLDAKGGSTADGTPVQIYDCNGTPAQKWDLSWGQSSKIALAGSNACIDWQPNPVNGRKLVLRPCSGPHGYHPEQQVWMANAEHFNISINPYSPTGAPPSPLYCMDNTDASTCNGNPVQLWECHKPNHPDQWHQGWVPGSIPYPF